MPRGQTVFDFHAINLKYVFLDTQVRLSPCVLSVQYQLQMSLCLRKVLLQTSKRKGIAWLVCVPSHEYSKDVFL